MLAIARFSVPLADAAQFEAQLSTALEAFSLCKGFISGEFGQNLDEQTLWLLVTLLALNQSQLIPVVLPKLLVLDH